MARLLLWLWANFSEEILKVKFILRMYNGIADLLSRWGGEEFANFIRKERNPTANNNVSGGCREIVHTMTDNEILRVLNDGHVGVETMKYRSKVWGILAKLSLYKDI